MEIIPTATLPSPAAVPEGTFFRVTGANVEIPSPMDVWVGDELFTCSWEKQEDKYVMVMRLSEAV